MWWKHLVAEGGYGANGKMARFTLRDDVIQGNIEHSVMSKMTAPCMPTEVELTDENDDGSTCETCLPREEVRNPLHINHLMCFRNGYLMFL